MSTSAHRIASDRTVPRCANVRTGASAIQFPENVIAHPASLDHCKCLIRLWVFGVNSVGFGC